MSEPEPWAYYNQFTEAPETATYPDVELRLPDEREHDMRLYRHLIGAIREIEKKWGLPHKIPERRR